MNWACRTDADKPKIHLLRHDMWRHVLRVVTCLSCVLHRACSKMADNEQAVVLTC